MLCADNFQGDPDIACIREVGHSGTHSCFIDDSHGQRKMFTWENDHPGYELTTVPKDPTVEILEKLFAELALIEDRLGKIEHAIQANHK
jgi:hypothetical protein